MARKKEMMKKNPEKENNADLKIQDKVLKKVFVGFGLIFVIVAVGFYVFYSMNHFDYKGVKFQVVKFCDAKPCLILYKTSLPVKINGEKADYNLYLRNDPRKTAEIPFEGNLNFLPNMVIDSQEDFNCNGDGIIAVKNLNILYSDIMGAKVVKNDSLKCDPYEKYLFLNIVDGNETKIEQLSPTCYNIEINNCEILDGTERFMLESLVKLNKILSSNPA